MEQQVVPFDLQRMFIGDLPPLFMLEIVARTLIIYVYAFTIVRFMSKRGMSELTPMEYLLIIAMGSAAGDPVFYDDVPLLHAMIVITLLIFVRRGLIYVTQRWEPLERIVEARPVMVIENGHILRDAIKGEELELGSLLAQLRVDGIRHVSEVEFAYLEPDGEVSIFRYEQPPEPARSVMPHDPGYPPEQATPA
jgi:uncharacterized membrane protein YcaP (DUF421 family)